MPADPKVTEIAKIKNKMLELEAQLKEARKVTSRLRDQYDKKEQQIAIIDAEIAAEIERFRWRKEDITFSMKAFEDESAGKIREMKEEEKLYQTDISEFEFIQYENERLHAKLKDVAAEQKSISTMQNFERDRKKQKDFDTRMAMEETLRKTIKNVDDTYENEAIAKMQMEASNAHIENENILREFSHREKTTEELIKQQQKSYEQLMKIKIERDVVEISLKILDKNTKRLHEQNLSATRDVGIFREKLFLLETEVNSLRDTLQRKETLKSKVAEIEKLRESYELEKFKIKALVLQLCHKMIHETFKIADKLRDQQNASLAKQLDDLSSQDDTSATAASIDNIQEGYADDLLLSNDISNEMLVELGNKQVFNVDDIWQIHPKNILPKLRTPGTLDKRLQKEAVSVSMIT